MVKVNLRSAVGRATGKIILMGEHAVVYGQPAIALPFSAVTITATVKPEGQDLSVNCAVYDGLVHEMPRVWEGLKQAIRLSLYRIGAPSNPAIRIEIASTIPPERGMGSSAAVAVAIARALFAFYEKTLSDEELHAIVNSAEKITHGNSSGIDTVTTSGSFPVWFIKGQTMEVLDFHLDAYLVVADTGQVGQTLEAVTDVAKLVKQQEEIKGILSALGQLTERTRTALQSQDIAGLGELLTQAQTYLKKLTVSDDQLDVLIEVALNNGALGAKLTGGGRGGCMIALTDSPETAKKVTNALQKAGAVQTWIQYLGE